MSGFRVNVQQSSHQLGESDKDEKNSDLSDETRRRKKKTCGKKRRKDVNEETLRTEEEKRDDELERRHDEGQSQPKNDGEVAKFAKMMENYLRANNKAPMKDHLRAIAKSFASDGSLSN